MSYAHALNVKQVIVIRKDLRMRRGKECAQAAHASMAWLTSRLAGHFIPQINCTAVAPGDPVGWTCGRSGHDGHAEHRTPNGIEWTKPHPPLTRAQRSSPETISLTDIEWAWVLGLFTKVVCQVASEAELRAVYANAKAAGLEAHLIIDSGKTEFNGIPTATALGIGPDEAEKINAVTGELKLY